MLLVSVDMLSAHVVLSLKLWHARLCILRVWIWRVHVLALEMVLIGMMMGAHGRAHLRQMIACVSLGCGVLHGVRAEPLQRNWNCRLVVCKRSWVH